MVQMFRLTVDITAQQSGKDDFH